MNGKLKQEVRATADALVNALTVPTQTLGLDLDGTRPRPPSGVECLRRLEQQYEARCLIAGAGFMADVSLTLLVLKTRQVDAMRPFYKTLGIDLAEEWHGTGPLHHAGRAGDVVIEIYPLPDDGTTADASTRLGFTVENLAEVIHALEGIGTPVVKRPSETAWGLQAVVRDPDGRAVELGQK